MFTIIIATHDRPLLLKRTLTSLISQTCQDFKVIIVSDTAGFLPPYQELIQLDKRFDFLIRRSGPAGPAASRNAGLALAESEYILFLDDDDSYLPTHLELLKARLLQDRPELLCHDFRVQNEDRTVYPPTLLGPAQPISIAAVSADSLFVLNRVPNSCVAYRRDVLTGLRHDTQMIIYEDWDFLLAALHGRRLVHFATDGVVIHKSEATAPENMRRGNTRDDKIVEVMLDIYRRRPAPNMATRLQRQSLMANAGVKLDLEYF